MVKHNVKVVIRTRPTANFASKNLQIDTSSNHINVNIPKDEHGGVVNNQQESWRFKFDRILHNSSQDDVFDNCARGIVRSVVDGFNGTVMVYGQTGAGKTFTMSGSMQNYKYRGLIPRAVSEVFQEIGIRFDNEYTVRVSYLEIYNELMFDLISSVPTAEQQGTAISIQDDAKGEIHVKGLTLNVCKNEEEALNFLFEGESNRTISAHQLNKESSRSHCIYTVHVESRSRTESQEKVIYSKLHLVDLAGSERIKKSGASGVSLKEATYINKSLTFLEQVVVSVCDNKREHIPYRQSKLTNFLKSSIGGNCQTVMIANIYPEPEQNEETIGTLKFASRMMKVSNEAVVNVQMDPELLLKKMEREIKELKQELTMHDTLANKGRVVYDTYTAEQQYVVQKQAFQFLEGEAEDIDEINSLRQVKELFAQMRNIYKKLEMDAKTIMEGKGEAYSRDGPSSSHNDLERRKTLLMKDGVGELDEIGEFGLGIAPSLSKPINKIEISKQREEEINRMQADDDEPRPQSQDDEDDPEKELEALRIKQSKANKRKAIDRNTAFLEFKSQHEGKPLEEQIIANRQDLKDQKQKVKHFTDNCNTSKVELDKIKGRLDAKADDKRLTQQDDMMGFDDEEGAGANPNQGQEIIDEEELALIQKMKELKKQYRFNFDGLKETKSQVSYTQQSIDNLKLQLVAAFEEWYSQTFDEDELMQSTLQKTSKTMLQSSAKKETRGGGNTSMKMIQDLGDEEDLGMTASPNGKDLEGKDIDPDALAFIKAKRHVDDLQKAKKFEKRIGGGHGA